MRIVLSQPRGFCAGVEMAVATVERALELFGAPLYAFHQIVHNRVVVEDFERRGVRFVEGIAEVPADAPVVFSAHGVSPAVRTAAAARGLKIIDATCPLVSKVHAEARRFAAEGYTIVFIGHAGHDETIGVIGEAPHRVVLIETLEDVDALRLPATSKVAYLTQTTLGVDDTRAIVAALEERYPGIVGPRHEDICYATQNRQTAIRTTASGADVAIIVGSRNSSNSQRLIEVAAKQGIPAHLVDGPEDLRPEWFAESDTVAVSAGASVPEGLTASTVAAIASLYGAAVVEHGEPEGDVHFLMPKAMRAS